jgi:hypothetical protein
VRMSTKTGVTTPNANGGGPSSCPKVLKHQTCFLDLGVLPQFASICFPMRAAQCVATSDSAVLPWTWVPRLRGPEVAHRDVVTCDGHPKYPVAQV